MPPSQGWTDADRQMDSVAVDSLISADSPRLAGVDESHVRVLAELVPELPPILVHRGTRRVIDGMHRLQAHRLRGYAEIAVEYFEGGDDEAFIVAVETNLYHGLPLSLDDRRAAALRILRANPRLSDRGVASVVGLSARTVHRIRTESAAAVDGPVARIGRDGRIRPINSAEGRRIAGELLKSRPTASLRQIAREVGISPATVRDVRDRMQRGEDPVIRPPTRIDAPRPVAVPAPPDDDKPAAAVVARDLLRELSKLRQDPSLRYTTDGRLLVRWLELHLPVGWDQLPSVVPPHSVELVGRIARTCADEWRAFARELEQ